MLPHAARDDKEISLDMLKAYDDNWLEIPDGWCLGREVSEPISLLIPHRGRCMRSARPDLRPLSPFGGL